MNDTIVFSLTANCELVKEICGYLNLEPGKLTVNHFADGETLVELNESIRGKMVYLVQSTYKPVNEKLMELLVAIDAIKRSSPKEIVCIIPNFGYARQDRKAKPRQPITARLVADLLEAAGCNRVVTIDLHAAQIQGFFSFPADDITSIPMMAQYFANKPEINLNKTVIVSPDHGGTTRARRFAERLDCSLAICDKRRPRPNVCETTNVLGDVNGMDCIIVDDMCDTGGSLIGAAKLLKENGAGNIYVAIAHGIFSKDALEKIEGSVIKEVVCTNSIPLSEEAKAKTTKVKQLSVGLMLSKIIYAISNHTPVSNVYNIFDDHENI